MICGLSQTFTITACPTPTTIKTTARSDPTAKPLIRAALNAALSPEGISLSGGRGILLLHDIKARTTLALPRLLAALKTLNYHVVHVVPAASGEPQVAPAPTTLKANAPHKFDE